MIFWFGKEPEYTYDLLANVDECNLETDEQASVTAYLRSTCEDKNGVHRNAPVTYGAEQLKWSIADPSVAKVENGTVTAIARGDTTLTVTTANGTLTVLFPTGHAFGITTADGVEILVHCGIDTVNAKGDGFRLLSKVQGDAVRAGDPIVEVDIRKLSKTYDMSTMLIITNPNERTIEFIEPGKVTRGQSVIK